jgi:hypothetical protein
MQKLMDILQSELNIVKGKKGMYAIDKQVFINKVWNGLYNQYLDGSICGTIKNSMVSIQYEAESICFTRMGFNEHNISILRRKNNNIAIDLNNVKSINISISDYNWIDMHFLSDSNDENYENYVSLVIRG